MYRSGFIAIIGRPNVGKSTLMNALLGQKIAVTSPRVQTTRTRIKGVLTVDGRGQIVFLDTPGFSKALDSMGECLTREAEQAMEEADGYLLVVDGSEPCGRGDVWLAERLKAAGKWTLIIVNKTDLIKDKAVRDANRDSYLRLFEGYPTWNFLTVSAKTGRRIQEVPKLLLKHLPQGEPIFDEDAVTDQRIRDIAQEIIREKLMRFTEDELPHSVAVLIELFDESNPACIKIEANFYVDKTSQKGMVIGKQGQMLKKIGEAARKDIEELVEGKVFLSLQVKVKPKWREDKPFLKLLGLSY
jgi:GTP-binding protein Era